MELALKNTDNNLEIIINFSKNWKRQELGKHFFLVSSFPTYITLYLGEKESINAYSTMQYALCTVKWEMIIFYFGLNCVFHFHVLYIINHFRVCATHQSHHIESAQFAFILMHLFEPMLITIVVGSLSLSQQFIALYFCFSFFFFDILKPLICLELIIHWNQSN